MENEPLKQLWSLAFGDSREVIDQFFSTGFHPRRYRCFRDGTAVTAALYWFDCFLEGRKYAYIYGVATHPDHRGKGLCRSLMDRTHRDLADLGYAGSLLMPAGSALRQMYAKMGYRDVGGLDQWEETAAHTGIPVRTVSPEDYAALRRQYLPEGGLIQEGENLDYLASWAGLYAGDAFVMAAVHLEDRLFVQELLGDVRSAPGILRAMGYKTGTFRSHGSSMAYAMFRPLTQDAPEPGYFGLGFD